MLKPLQEKTNGSLYKCFLEQRNPSEFVG